MEPDSLSTTLIVFVVSLILSALYAFLETTVATMRLFKLKELAGSTRGYRGVVKTLEEYPHRIFTAILIASSLVDAAATMSAGVLAHYFLGNLPGAYILELITVSAVLLILADIVPKNIAKALGDKMFSYTLGLTALTYYIFYPFVLLVVRLSDNIVDRVGALASVQQEGPTSENEVQFLIDYVAEHGLMEPEKSSMLKSIFKLNMLEVRSIMVPMPRVVALDAQTSFSEALELFSRHQFSRFPLYELRPDNIVGMLYVKDLLSLYRADEGAFEKKPIRSIMRPILYIPESIRVNQLLKEFKQQHMHLAMVLDEHGSIVGLVTLEDALEEIVGEIKDEHESAIEKIVPLKHDSWLVDASVELPVLGNYLGITFEVEDAVTLSGFLIERMQRLPKKGDQYAYKQFIFQVQNATPKKIVQVVIFATHTGKELVHDDK